MMARLRCDDRGVVLVIVLLFLVLFASFGVAIIGLAATSLRETNSIGRTRAAAATAEGAIDVAIRRGLSSFQTNIATIAAGGAWTCPGSTTTANGVSATAACTIIGTAVAGDSNPKPTDAIMTLGGAVTQSKRGGLIIGGNVFAGGAITVSDSRGTMTVQGTAKATSGTCPRVTASGGVTCPTSPGPSDPAYTPALATAPSTVASVPATCSSAIVTFDPPAGGLFYNDAAALSKLTNGKTASCKGKIIWFKPGVHYFNFTVGGGTEWVVDDANVNVVGGAQKGGWDTQPALRPSFPGGCDPDATTGSPGAQFVFGGASRLNVKKGTTEICRAITSTQSIAVLGPRSDGSGYVHQSGTILKLGGKGRLAVQGTVYAPLGVVELDTTKIVTSVVSRGIIAKSVKLKSTPFAGKAILVPPSPANADIDVTVRLVATVNSEDRLDVLVTYSRRYNGSSSYSTSISRWEVLR